MSSIEEIAKTFAGLPLAVGARWSVHQLIQGRVALSRDHQGRFSLFVMGPRESFGTLPRIAGMDFSDSIEAVPTGGIVKAARLTSSSVTFGNRVMAHVAYELERRLAADPGVANDVLISDVRWILELLSDRDSILSEEMRKGLLGELVLLRKLLLVAQEAGVPASAVLDRWNGCDRAKRDFSGPGVAVEVKTTSGDSRIHHVGSLAQLEPQPGEEVFLFSVGVKSDSSAPKRLPDYVADVCELLVTSSGSPDSDLKARFEGKLELYGYERARESLYRACPGYLKFHLAPKLFPESQLERVRLSSFKGDALPGMVLDVAYRLDVQAQELDVKEEKRVLRRLLGLAVG